MLLSYFTPHLTRACLRLPEITEAGKKIILNNTSSKPDQSQTAFNLNPPESILLLNQQLKNNLSDSRIGSIDAVKALPILPHTGAFRICIGKLIAASQSNLRLYHQVPLIDSRSCEFSGEIGCLTVSTALSKPNSDSTQNLLPSLKVMIIAIEPEFQAKGLCRKIINSLIAFSDQNQIAIELHKVKSEKLQSMANRSGFVSHFPRRSDHPDMLYLKDC